MSVSSPRTARDALLAEVLDEVDLLHRQVAALPQSLGTVEVKLAHTVSVLDQAADNFRMAVTAFSEQAKVDLLEFHERKTVEASNRILNEQHLTIQSMVDCALVSGTNNQSKQTAMLVNEIARRLHRQHWLRSIEYAMASLAVSAATAGLLFWVLRVR